MSYNLKALLFLEAIMFSWRPLAVLLLFLQACSIPQHTADLRPDAAPTLSKSEEKALDSTLFTLGEWPSANWWEMFKDCQLNALVEKALRDSPTLKKAAARVEHAKQIAMKRRSTLFPQLYGSAQTDWEYLSKDGLFRSIAPTVPPTYDETTVGISFEYEFDFWGKYTKIFKAAVGEKRAQEAEKYQAALVLSVSVAEVYFDIQMDMARLKILGDTLKDRREFYDLRQARVVNGLDNNIIRNIAEQDVFSLQKMIVRTEERLQTNHHLLHMLLGEGPDVKEEIHYKQTQLKNFQLPKEISLNLVARRPDLMAQIWRVEAAAKLIGAAKADFYPNVNLYAFGGFDSLQFHNLFTWANKVGTLLPAINLPIFTGGKLTANLREKAAAFEEAVYHYNELVLRAVREVADELTIMQKVGTELHLQKKLVKSKAQDLALMNARFSQGVSNFLDVLHSEEEVLSQQLIAIDIEYVQLTSALRLIKALGGGYETPYPVPSEFGGSCQSQ